MMRGLASFVMQGFSQAVMVVTGFAMLSLIVPPVGILASAAIGLMTLRRGGALGASLLVASAFCCGVLAWLTIGQVLTVVGILLISWLPVWALSVMLRTTRSLNVTVQSALGFGVLIIVANLVQSSDPTLFWKEMLAPVAENLVEAQVMDASQAQGFITQMAGWMTGILAAAFYLQSIVALFLARGWQAVLYNPGGFQKEFHGLRFSSMVALAGIVFASWLLLQGAAAPSVVRYMGLLALTAFFVQGLAVAHNVVKSAGMHVAWLFGLYILLFVAMPYAELVLALIGMLDPWLDFRSRSSLGSRK
ncbi:MAG TPA: DUF2232 domain-containing protein [Chromatiales bacterium]|nr:DUF2232 domain-containing protein [Chromatiales bacterium]